MDIESLIEETRGWSETSKTCGNSFVSAAFERAANAMESLYSERNELFQMNVNQAKTIQKLSAYKEAAEKQEPVGRFNGSFEYIDGHRSFRVACFKELPKNGAHLYAEPLPSDKPAVAVPDGWKLVPIDSTEEMRKAGENAISYNTSSQMVWKEMLTAAPSHSQQSDQGA